MKTVGLVKFVNVCYALVEEWGHGDGCCTKLRKIKKRMSMGITTLCMVRTYTFRVIWNV